MANEITRSAYTITYKKGSTGTLSRSVPEQKMDVTGDDYDPGFRQAIASTETALTMGTITAGGLWHFKNTEAAGGSTISIRAATAQTNLIDLLPGEECTIRLAAAATAPYAISSSGTVDLEMTRIDL